WRGYRRHPTRLSKELKTMTPDEDVQNTPVTEMPSKPAKSGRKSNPRSRRSTSRTAKAKSARTARHSRTARRSQNGNMTRAAARRSEGEHAGLISRGRQLASEWVGDRSRAIHMPSVRMPSMPGFDAIGEASPVILGAVGLGIGVLIGA